MGGCDPNQKHSTISGEAHERFTYDDFGDPWLHEITVHRVWRMVKGVKFAVYMDGATHAHPPTEPVLAIIAPATGRPATGRTLSDELDQP